MPAETAPARGCQLASESAGGGANVSRPCAQYWLTWSDKSSPQAMTVAQERPAPDRVFMRPGMALHLSITLPLMSRSVTSVGLVTASIGVGRKLSLLHRSCQCLETSPGYLYAGARIRTMISSSSSRGRSSIAILARTAIAGRGLQWTPAASARAEVAELAQAQPLLKSGATTRARRRPASAGCRRCTRRRARRSCWGCRRFS